jgi:hypothetical protein
VFLPAFLWRSSVVEGPGSEIAKSPGVLGPASILLLLFSLRVTCSAGFGAPAARAALEHMTVMQQTVEHGGHSGAVAEQLAPVVDGTIGSQQRTGPFRSGA